MGLRSFFSRVFKPVPEPREPYTVTPEREELDAKLSQVISDNVVAYGDLTKVSKEVQSQGREVQAISQSLIRRRLDENASRILHDAELAHQILEGRLRVTKLN